jgi:SAM-dependent methyltransferase
MNVSDIYDQHFFEAHLPWRNEYSCIADVLASRLNFDSVLDLGCGNGFILARLVELGKDVTGIDGSHHAIQLAAPEVASRIQLMNLTEPLWLGRHDLVFCSEVAEHVDPCFADTLVNNICVNSHDLIFFTAAVPGQGGYYHVNEQPHEHWIDQFRRRKFLLDEQATVTLREDLSQRLHTLWLVHEQRNGIP